jgi:hypothetical protein
MKQPHSPPLGEIDERILAELDEAGFENIFTLANTVFPPEGLASEIYRPAHALGRLLAHGLIDTAFRHGPPRGREVFTPEQSRALLDRLDDWFSFEPGRSRWTLKKGDPRPTRIPEIALTPAGIEKSRHLLGRRGYQWWRRPSPERAKFADRATPEPLVKIAAAFHQDVFVVNSSLEEAVTKAIAGLTPAERTEAKAFLAVLLAGGQEPGAVRHVWRRLPTEIVIRDRAGMVALFALIRDRL